MVDREILFSFESLSTSLVKYSCMDIHLYSQGEKGVFKSLVYSIKFHFVNHHYFISFFILFSWKKKNDKSISKDVFISDFFVQR